jgi:hypothetical protein
MAYWNMRSAKPENRGKFIALVLCIWNEKGVKINKIGLYEDLWK